MTTAKRISLTEDQRTTLTCALYLAADKYLANAKELNDGDYRSMGGRPLDQPTAHRRIAEQFLRQAIDARKMAELIDGAENIELG